MDLLIRLFPLWAILLSAIAPGPSLKHFYAYRVQTIEKYLPLIAAFAIVLVIAIITAPNVQQFSKLGLSILFAVALHNLSGIFIGYYSAKLLGYKTRECRTLAIEVGMQNSGLAVAWR